QNDGSYLQLLGGQTVPLIGPFGSGARCGFIRVGRVFTDRSCVPQWGRIRHGHGIMRMYLFFIRRSALRPSHLGRILGRKRGITLNGLIPRAIVQFIDRNIVALGHYGFSLEVSLSVHSDGAGAGSRNGPSGQWSGGAPDVELASGGPGPARLLR